MAMTAAAPTIRDATERDMEALDAIYAHYIRETPITFDLETWPPGKRAQWLAERHEQRDVVLVAELDGRAAGFAWSAQFRPKAAYRTTAEVSFYCAPDACGRGLGTALLSPLLARLAALGRHRAVAGVTLPNPASRALLTRHAFTSVGVLHEVGFKLDRYWDVEWFERPLTAPRG